MGDGIGWRISRQWVEVPKGGSLEGAVWRHIKKRVQLHSTLFQDFMEQGVCRGLFWIPSPIDEVKPWPTYTGFRPVESLTPIWIFALVPKDYAMLRKLEKPIVRLDRRVVLIEPSVATFSTVEGYQAEMRETWRELREQRISQDQQEATADPAPAAT